MAEHLRFGGGSNASVLHPIVAAAMVIAVIILLVMPRKFLIAPLLAMSFLVPVGQQLVVGGFHVFILRIVLLAGLLRMASSRYRSWWGRFPGGFDEFDKLFLAWALFRALAFVLLFSQKEAFVNQIGFLWDSLGAFFLLRFLFQENEDIERAVRVLAMIAVILASSMTYEHFRGINVFGLLGGVDVTPAMRRGSYRAQGPFAHALLAGTFGATLPPLFLWLWARERSRTFAVIGLLASAAMVATTNCSTPIIALAAGLFGACLWPLRGRMRLVRWGLVMVLLSLHLAMKAPVWFLIARIDLVGGSSSDHRAELVNMFITRVSDWWLIGADSANWGWGMWDTANQYVGEGLAGGMATFVCFLGLIALAFRRVGRARKAVAGDRKQEWCFWLLGATLFSHVVGFFGISYFDQTRVAWFSLLAMISAAVAPILARVPISQGELALTTGAPTGRPAGITPGLSSDECVYWDGGT